MYLPLNKVLTIYEILCESKNLKKTMKFSVYTLRLGLSNDLEDSGLKYAEDFYSICYIFNRKHGTIITVDGIEIYKWIKLIRIYKLVFSGKLLIEVKLKEK
jgi:hypothetical protein